MQRSELEGMIDGWDQLSHGGRRREALDLGTSLNMELAELNHGWEGYEEREDQG